MMNHADHVNLLKPAILPTGGSWADFGAGSGAFTLALLIERHRPLRWLQPAYLALVGITGLLFVPFAIPILPPEMFIQANAAIGGAGDVKQENRQTSALPQSYADRYGWKEMVATIAQAYTTLTPEEKSGTCILARNYGEAGAVDYYGPALGLPKAISGHNSYFHWGPQGCTGKVIITINYIPSDIASAFESVEYFGKVACTYCMPDENGAPIFIARGLKMPMEEGWPTVKNYD